MPEMGGAETIRGLKGLVGEKMPIIIISAYDYADIEADAKSVSVDDFIAKPLFQSSVFDLLLNVCGK